MSELNEQRLVELVTEEVQRALAGVGGTKSGTPTSCGTGIGPRDAGPGRGAPAMGQSPTPLNPTPKTPCKATGQECISCGWSVSRRPEDTRKIVKLGACRISSRPQVGAAVAPDIAGYIDHTLLKPETTLEQLDELCAEAAKYKFASVCINPVHIRYCKRRLQGSGVMVVTVVGFPLGATSTAAKVAETRRAVEDGADEIDMVINIGLLKSTAYRDVEEDIRRVVKAAHPKPVKVIIETSKLSREEKVIASALSKAAGAHFVKTSTGFGGGGATAEDVALMKQVVGRDIEVKASGGVRSIDDAVKMLEAGATRLGASASVAIVSGKTVKSSGY